MQRGSVPPRLDGRTVLFLVTEDWYFWSHRVNIARAARDAGARVVVATNLRSMADAIASEGFTPVHIPFDRSGLNPFSDFGTFMAIVRAFRKHRPDLVHNVAAKPVLYGTLAARVAGVAAVVNAIAGLGYLFADRRVRTRVARFPLEFVLRWATRSDRVAVIVQNEDDGAILEDRGVPADSMILIPGSGVDLDAYPALAEPPSPPVVAVCAARMLWSKGIGELVAAARLLRARRVPIVVRLVGGSDANPARIPKGTLARWRDEGIVEIVGRSGDVAGEYARAHIAVLPSYREGLPKALLEAGSCGRPLVSTDVPGCRDVCRDGETGILVPVEDAESLAAALERLAADPDLRRRLGAGARAMVEAEYSSERISAMTLDVYRALLSATPVAETSAT